jgi:hypothetical protein
MTDLPPLALPVRQPWAWAIIHGGKVIENRSLGAIRSGAMDCRTICIHAASGMTEKEYRWGLWRLDRHGVACPRPDTLVRSAIIGTVDVVDIITQSDSEWFGGQAGLLLENPAPVDPVPCPGALGYFEWRRAGDIAAPKRWMRKFASGENATPDLFPDARPQFKSPPSKPFL